MMTSLVFGASLKPGRYSSIAVKRFQDAKMPVAAYGIASGEIHGVQIKTNLDSFQNIHTVTLYVNPKIQALYYDKIIQLQPKRVIFNPGTENPEFYELLRKKNIAVVEACTLVLLATGQYEQTY